MGGGLIREGGVFIGHYGNIIMILCTFCILGTINFNQVLSSIARMNSPHYSGCLASCFDIMHSSTEDCVSDYYDYGLHLNHVIICWPSPSNQLCIGKLLATRG